ncbi:hypothetical protein CYLTODRAFT_427060 [Cylindrobasidium torrendii FP15055 ss-10]|uniref:Uncharacterized protein n=1 Tax=Cylindrobasidium torrendii FP15055 ss-10 TaxID=1314674 RepID=A0A0D7AV43_9AGAR|nr:hypothetical protein CYLTODRAFT_427060 [Cylindrobasidium torrendii FP15055 ss-10]
MWSQKGKNFDLTSVLVSRTATRSRSRSASSTSNVYVVDMSYGIHLYEVRANEEATEQWDISGRRSGGAGLSPDGRFMACWSLCSNIYIYDLEQKQCVRAIDVPQIVNDYDNVELYVQYIHGGRDLVVGSNHGRPCIINLSEETVVEELLHCAANALVPYVVYASYKGMDIIITADTGRGEETKVKMWRRGKEQWSASGAVQSLVGWVNNGLHALWALLVRITLLLLFIMAAITLSHMYSTFSESRNGLGYGLVNGARTGLATVGRSLSDRYTLADDGRLGLRGDNGNLKIIFNSIVNQAREDQLPPNYGAAADKSTTFAKSEAVDSTANVPEGTHVSVPLSTGYRQERVAFEGGTERDDTQAAEESYSSPSETEAAAQGWGFAGFARFAAGVREGMRG